MLSPGDSQRVADLMRETAAAELLPRFRTLSKEEIRFKRPGDVVTVTVTRGAPHYLLSDATPLSVRRTQAGDAWAAAAASAPVSAAPVSAAPVPAAAPVLLGMPARHPAG